MANKQVAVVVPFYKPVLTDYEAIALQQCRNVLGKHLLIAIKPEGMDMPATVPADMFNSTVNFNDMYFNSIAGYNRLMLSYDFYNAFSDFEYILIYQLDAFVLKDELNYWCSKNYDYIGAPWIRKNYRVNLLKSVLLSVQKKLSTRFDLKKKGLPNKYQFEGKVGNGGFSLRRVKVMKDITLRLKPKIEEYLKKDAHQYNEDSFWSVEVNRKQQVIKIPLWQTALNFAFENKPESCLELNDGKLPFGCHAWDKNIGFWRPVFKEIGIQI